MDHKTWSLVSGSRYKKFLASYLNGRQVYTEFRGCRSKFRIVTQGVPQGGVLSPLLFNLYMSKMPNPPGKVKVFTYADDTTVLNSGPTIPTICAEINPYLDKLETWFTSRHLQISAAKSQATVFTTFSNEANIILPVSISGAPIPSTSKPKILGIVMDSMLNFGQHAADIKKKLSSRNNVLKALTGTTWGKDKEVLTTTYKAIGRSVLNYGTQVWSPFLSETNWQVLQNSQNHALRIITGCTKMSQISHLHQETKIIPVKPHSELLSKQFMRSVYQDTHPNNHHLTQPNPPRLMRTCILNKHKNEVNKYITPNVILDMAKYKEDIQNIHTETVGTTLANYPLNKVLMAHPPAHKLGRKVSSQSNQDEISTVKIRIFTIPEKLPLQNW